MSAADASRKFSPKEIGARFAKARKAAKLTQEKLADRMGILQTSISRFETGQRGVETESLLAAFFAVADAGGNLDYVVRGVGEPLRTEVELIATTPELAEQLRALQRRLEATGDKRSIADETPRTRDKSR